jgi:hypothetical protein
MTEPERTKRMPDIQACPGVNPDRRLKVINATVVTHNTTVFSKKYQNTLSPTER